MTSRCSAFIPICNPVCFLQLSTRKAATPFIDGVAAL